MKDNKQYHFLQTQPAIIGLTGKNGAMTFEALQNVQQKDYMMLALPGPANSKLMDIFLDDTEKAYLKLRFEQEHHIIEVTH